MSLRIPLVPWGEPKGGKGKKWGHIVSYCFVWLFGLYSQLSETFLLTESFGFGLYTKPWPKNAAFATRLNDTGWLFHLWIMMVVDMQASFQNLTVQFRLMFFQNTLGRYNNCGWFRWRLMSFFRHGISGYLAYLDISKQPAGFGIAWMSFWAGFACCLRYLPFRTAHLEWWIARNESRSYYEDHRNFTFTFTFTFTYFYHLLPLHTASASLFYWVMLVPLRLEHWHPLLQGAPWWPPETWLRRHLPTSQKRYSGWSRGATTPATGVLVGWVEWWTMDTLGWAGNWELPCFFFLSLSLSQKFIWILILGGYEWTFSTLNTPMAFEIWEDKMLPFPCGFAKHKQCNIGFCI